MFSIGFILKHQKQKYPYKMTLIEIYDRIDELILLLQKNPEDQDCLFKCEMEIAYLEEVREEMEADF